MLGKALFITYLIVPIVNFGVFFLDPEGRRFDIDPEVILEPAGYAFSIWSVIFVGMILWSYQIMKHFDENDPKVKKAIWAAISAGLASICFVPLSLIGIQWLIWIDLIWHLISLILLFKACQELRKRPDYPISRWFDLGPQMYLGWICAATAVGSALALREMGVQYNETLEINITILVLLAFAYIGQKMAEIKGSTVGLVLVWALIGLIVNTMQYPKMEIACIIIAAIILLSIGFALKKGKAFI